MLHFFILKLSDFLTHKSVYIITMIRYTVYFIFLHNKEDSALHCPLLSSFKKELEADSQFGPEGTSMLIVVAFLVLQVIVFNAGNHVLSERQRCRRPYSP